MRWRDRPGVLAPRSSFRPSSGNCRSYPPNSVVKDLHPEVSAYAEDMAQRLAARGSYSTVDAQRAVQNLNNSLKAFYSNPTYETASRASIDAMVANQLRSGLDKAIEQATGPGYQELKNQYGGLKAIEKDVVHRAVVEGRKNLGGGIMGNIGDLASADEVIRGVLTLNPAAVARGAAIKGFTTFVKHLRDPNRAVSRLFDAADQQQRVREAARQAIPTEKSVSPLALPPPSVPGPGAPWIKAGESLMPGGPAFTMEHPSPLGTRPLMPNEARPSLPPAQQQKVREAAKQLLRLAAPTRAPLKALPAPKTLYGPAADPVDADSRGSNPAGSQGFVTDRPTPPANQ